MRRAVRELLSEMERHGVRVLGDGRLQVAGQAPAALLMRAHRNRRALLALVRGERG